MIVMLLCDLHHICDCASSEILLLWNCCSGYEDFDCIHPDLISMESETSVASNSSIFSPSCDSSEMERPGNGSRCD